MLTVEMNECVCVLQHQKRIEAQEYTLLSDVFFSPFHCKKREMLKLYGTYTF